MNQSLKKTRKENHISKLILTVNERFDRLESQMATKEDIKSFRKEVKLEFKTIRRSLAHLAETSPTLESFQKLEARVNRYSIAS